VDDASVGGLSAARAAELLQQHGANELPRAPRRSVLSRAARQLRDPMLLLLVAAGVVTTSVGDITDTIVIAAVLVLNTTLGTVQEVRAERAITALQLMAAPHATVVRDGSAVQVAAATVVPGDLLLLAAGDVVAADAELGEAHRLQLDESAMTGESVPVEREVGGEVLAGTVVTRGRGTATVTRTGEQSALGRIAALVLAAPERATPLQQRLTRLSGWLVVGVLLLSTLVLVLGVLRGRSLLDMLIVGVSLSVAAVPESLPAVVAVALALGAHRMALRSAIVRRLPAVETLGSVTVIATDKTGTITEGRMVAQRVWTPAGEFAVSGSGYAPDGEITAAGASAGADLARLLRDGVLCNDARVVEPEEAGEWTALGDPLEAALVAVAAKGGVRQAEVSAGYGRAAELPFDAGRRRMTTLHRRTDGRWLAVCKGAPEVVLGLVEDPEVTRQAHGVAERWAGQGLRVIAVADAEYAERPAALEEGLGLVGLVGIADPPRATAASVVSACHAAGVRLVLVTGDHPETARAVAGQVGITEDAPEVIDGAEVARGAHIDRVDSVGVYARTHPEQKVDIVRALQGRGRVVAMTGDGVNDAPALRAADIGVAMGRGGTEVARQAADLVLADDDLRTVVVAVEEGRRIFRNIRAFLRYAMSGGFAEIAVMLVGPFLGIAVPLLPAQILWINMLTHGLPGVAFGAEPLDPGSMREPSRSPRAAVLGEGLAVQIALLGCLIAAVALGAGLLAVAGGGHVQTHIFLTLGLSQLGVALALRAKVRHRTLRQRGLEVAVLAAVVLQLAGAYVGPLQELLGTQPVPAAELLGVLALSVVPGGLLALVRAVRSRGADAAPGGPNDPRGGVDTLWSGPRADIESGAAEERGGHA